MRLSPILNFNGDCEAALKFYAKCLGGKIVTMMTWGESPMAKNVSPKFRKKIIHATFALGDQTLGAGDAPPNMYQKPQGYSVALDIAKPAEAERVFKLLSKNGTVKMPIEETFWAKRFGMCVDQFGTPWLINCGKPLPKRR